MITRFAPSPTGPLHLGHAYSAILAHDMARAAGGQFLLRFDDLDQSRARAEWEELISEDLSWLGLTWDAEPRRQSLQTNLYDAAISVLADRGLVYPCCCKRRDILAAASAAHEGEPPMGPDGVVYPGTCRGRALSDAKSTDALRLDMTRAMLPTLPDFVETGPRHTGHHRLDPSQLIHAIGDPVLARPGLAAAYNLAVVLDDRAAGVTHVVRGEDLFEATYLQRFYHALLGITPPIYHHHRLVRDETGNRLAKRDDARALRTLREEGLSPQDIRAMTGL